MKRLPHIQPHELTEIVKEEAIQLNFDLVRITSAESFTVDRDVTMDRIKSGHMDGLQWFTEARVSRGTNPSILLPGSKSIISLGVNYFQHRKEHSSKERPTGKVAVYAWGRDYHKVIKRQMRTLVANLSERLDSTFESKWYIDDGPMLDRAVARRSGMGWVGKNTNLLSSEFGSWIFLGQIITNLELRPDDPIKKTCGNCIKCIDKCPTGAITSPHIIDNTKCISYLTIENRGPIPINLRSSIGDWIFGCDICQDVCPVNTKSQISNQPEFTSNAKESVDLIELLGMTEDQFLDRFQGTPIMRAKFSGMQRNACVALGNIGSTTAIPALGTALNSDYSLVRGHSAWALGKLGTSAATDLLSRRLNTERDQYVIDEITTALKCPSL